jgi:hypothetical protein
MPVQRVTIELPQEYDATELSFRPLQAQWVTKRKYTVTQPAGGTARLGKLWIVFPNPMKSQLQVAKAVLAFLVGVFTLVIHIPAFRERRISWSIAVFGLSLVLLVLGLYYSYSLTRRLEFVEWAAGFVPHALYGLATSVFLLLARRRQATITGLITAGGAAREFADVVLCRVVDGERAEEKRIDALSKEGRYVFHVWLRQEPARFLVTASARGTTEAATEEFEVNRGKRMELPPVELQWRSTGVQVTQGETVATPTEPTGT